MWCWWCDLSPTSKSCHQRIWSPTSVSNIDVTISTYWLAWMFISETQYRRNPIPGYVMIHSLPSPLFSQVFLDISLEYRFLIESYLSDSPVKVNHSVVTICNFIILAFLILRLVQRCQTRKIFEVTSMLVTDVGEQILPFSPLRLLLCSC